MRMSCGCRWVCGVLIFLLVMGCGLSRAASEHGSASKKTETREVPKDKGETEAAGVNLLPSPEESPVPLKTEKLDEAGVMLGKKIDEVGNGASKKIGKWVNARAFLGITWLKLIICLALLLLVMVLDWSLRRVITSKIRFFTAEDGSLNWWGVFFNSLSKPLSLFIRVYGVYWALSPLFGYFEGAGGQNLVHRVAGKTADLGGTVALFWFAYRFVDVVDIRFRQRAASSQSAIDSMLMPLLGKTFRIFIIVIGSMLIIQNVTGIELGPLIASLGIGGLAFALAGKDSIANFLGSLTILLDKPFQVGERVIIAGNDGFVENVGFRSTRLRTMEGNLVSIPNEKIINSTLENVGKRPHIRWKTNLTISYETPPEKVEQAVEIVREILDNHEGMQSDFPPRVFFNAFNDWNLNISVHVWYHPPDFWNFQAWVQKTCLEIMRRFQEEGIEFAFPTQTVYQLSGEKPRDIEILGKDDG